MLAPSTEEVSQILNGSFSSVVSLTAWSHGIVNTTLTPLDPVPAWYDGLNSEISSLQVPAQHWLDETGPYIGSKLAQSFIDYGEAFQGQASDMISLMADIQKNAGNTPTADQLEELNSDLATLLSQAGTEHSLATTVGSEMTTFCSSVQAAHKSLASSITAAAATLGADESLVAALASQISTLQQQLATVTQQAQSSMQTATIKGASLSMSVVSFAVTALVAGTATGVLGIAGGFVALGIDIAETIKNNAQILNDMKAITSLQAQLLPEEQQVASLQGIISNLDALETLNTSASNLYTGLLPSLWESVASDLTAIVHELKQPNVDVTLIDSLVQLPQAVSAWTAIIGQATNIQNSSLTVGDNVVLTADPAANSAGA